MSTNHESVANRAPGKVHGKAVKQARSLSFHVTVWLGVAVAVGMGGYAVLEYLTTPGLTLWGLAVHHGWHVLALGTGFYAVSWLAMNRLVVRPLNRIYLHLYAIGGGARAPLDQQSKVAEIESIVEGINLMLFRLDGAKHDPSLSALKTDIALLLHEVEQLDASTLQTAKATMLERLRTWADSVEGNPLSVPASVKPR